jgi:hypothetical protein
MVSFHKLSVCAIVISGISFTDNSLADAPGPWTQYQGNAAHTGYVAGSVNAAALQEVWSVSSSDIGASSFAEGAVTDSNHVYLTAFDHRTSSYSYYDIVALNRISGEIDWTRSLASYGSPISAPAAANGKVYVHVWGHSAISGGNASQFPYLYGLSAATGAVAFATRLDGYNSTSGTKLWSSEVNQQYGWIPAADGQRVYVYMGSASASPGPQTGTLYAFNRSNGSMAFTIQDSLDTHSLRDGTVTLGDQNDALALIRTAQGNAWASFDLLSHSVKWHAYGNYDGAIAIHGGLIYAANGIELSVLSEATGEKLRSWFAPPSESLTGNLLITDNMAFVGTSLGTYGINLDSLEAVWSTSTPGDLALGNNLLLISNSTSVTAFSVPEASSLVLIAAAFAICATTRHIINSKCSF